MAPNGVFIALFLWPGSGYIYDLLAAPLMSALPQGTTITVDALTDQALTQLGTLGFTVNELPDGPH